MIQLAEMHHTSIDYLLEMTNERGIDKSKEFVSSLIVRKKDPTTDRHHLLCNVRTKVFGVTMGEARSLEKPEL